MIALPSTRKFQGIIVAYLQFGLVAGLVAALSAEYQANTNQQAWIIQNASWLQYFLNGYMSAALIGIAIGAGFLLMAEIFGRRRRGVMKRTI